MSRMQAGSSSIPAPRAQLGLDSTQPELNLAQPKFKGQHGPPLKLRSPSRGRSKNRKPASLKLRAKGGLTHSKTSRDRGKLPATRESSQDASPAHPPARGNPAQKVFDKMPSTSAAPQQMRSWAAVAKSASKGYSLSYIPPVAIGNKLQVSISEDILRASDPKWGECLVGYLIGKKLPFKLVEAALKHVWGNKMQDIMANDEGFFFFHLPDKEVRKEILECGPDLDSPKECPLFLVVGNWH